MKAVKGDAGTYGQGGLGPTDKNPNKHGMLNDAPEGPFSHQMGYVGDGGYQGGSDTVSGKNGGSFHFK